MSKETTKTFNELKSLYREASSYRNDLEYELNKYSYLDYAEWLIDFKTRADAFHMLSFAFGEDFANDALCEANQCINAIERKLLVGDKIPETVVTKRFEPIVKKNLGL